MDAVIVMGAVNLLLCAWIVFLQRELKVLRLISESAIEIVRRLALEEIEFERDGKSITIKEKKA